MTNGNEEPRIYIGIGEPTYNASTSDHTTKGDANKKELTSTFVDHSPARCPSQRWINTDLDERNTISQCTQTQELVRREGSRKEIKRTSLLSPKYDLPAEYERLQDRLIRGFV